MKKTFTKLFLVLFCFSFSKLGAQSVLAANYSFSSSIGVFNLEDNSNQLGDDTNDDVLFDDTPIGFTFTYCGVPYSSVCVSSNGYFKFGQTMANASQNPIANSGGDDTLFCGLAADLQANTGAVLSYTTIGSAPNRTFVVQWEDYTYYGEADDYSFQIRLHETSNVLEVVYGNVYIDAVANAYQVGLRGHAFTDYNNRSVVESVNTWPTSTQGTSQSDHCDLSPTPFVPSTGQSYVWSPPCAQPNVTVTASQQTICSGSSVTFTASGATTYTWNTNATTPTISATPTANATYTVIGSSAASCTIAKTVTVGVVQGPSITISAQPTNSFCPGQSGTLVANGANNGFTWTPGGSTFAIIYVAPSSNTTYSVVGANTPGCTTTQTIALFMTTCTSVYDPAYVNEQVRIFPNPSNGVFVIEMPNGAQKHIEVMDLMGRIVLNTTSVEDRSTINISDLQNAVYYIRLSSNNDSKIFKMVKE
jgi:hypothetical protein